MDNLLLFVFAPKMLRNVASWSSVWLWLSSALLYRSSVGELVCWVWNCWDVVDGTRELGSKNRKFLCGGSWASMGLVLTSSHATCFVVSILRGTVALSCVCLLYSGVWIEVVVSFDMAEPVCVVVFLFDVVGSVSS